MNLRLRAHIPILVPLSLGLLTFLPFLPFLALLPLRPDYQVNCLGYFIYCRFVSIKFGLSRIDVFLDY